MRTTLQQLLAACGVAGVFLAIASSSAMGDDATKAGWKTQGRAAVIVQNERRTDGKTVSISVSNANRTYSRGTMTGVVFRISLSGHSDKFVGISSDDLKEFDPRCYLPGGPTAINYSHISSRYERILDLMDDLGGLDAKTKSEIARNLFNCYGECGLDIAEELRDVMQDPNRAGEAVRRFTENVRVAAHVGGTMPLNEKIALAYRSTIYSYTGSMRARAVTGFHMGIIDSW